MNEAGYFPIDLENNAGLMMELLLILREQRINYFQLRLRDPEDASNVELNLLVAGDRQELDRLFLSEGLNVKGLSN